MTLAYYDGAFVDKDDIKISPFDYGFARGMTLFEFTRLYGGKPFRLDDHIRRFQIGALAMGMQLPVTLGAITQAVHHLAAQNRFAHSAVKFYLTQGESRASTGFGFKGSADFTPHFMMIEEEVHPKHPEAPRGTDEHRRGIALKTVPFMRQIAEAKSINYAAGFIAARQLGDAFDEILYTNPDGTITETTTSNFFCVIDGVLCTPAQDMLKGVTRSVMLELARTNNISAAERDITSADLAHASEAFITGTFIEMLPVRRVDDIAFKATTDAPVYSALRKTFSTFIATTCHGAAA